MNSWSFSALVDFYEKCPRKYWFKYIQKTPEPPRDADHPAERGNRIHMLSEKWLKEPTTFLPDDLSRFEYDFRHLPQNRIAEEEWAFTKEWEPTSWKSPDAWLRMKLDIHTFDGQTVRIIDLKTGKKLGNEIKHTWQAQLYCLGASHWYPEATEFKTEFWYVDHGDKLCASYPRGHIIETWTASWERRANRMLNDQLWKPMASKSNCRYCQYNQLCEYAVE